MEPRNDTTRRVSQRLSDGSRNERISLGGVAVRLGRVGKCWEKCFEAVGRVVDALRLEGRAPTFLVASYQQQTEVARSNQQTDASPCLLGERDGQCG